tara:strand:- start:1580 stop:2221 length:642 start_codon:yes stop_codon:yes gene_type:complete
MESNIQNILKEILQLLINYIQKNNIIFTFNKKNNNLSLINSFIIETIKAPFESYNGCNIHGFTIINVGKWINIKPGLKIADITTMVVKEMKICVKTFDNKNIAIEAIIHTFIHELAHTVSIPELVLSKNITKQRKKIQPTVENKKCNHYMQNHHSDSFYSNFARLLRIAELLDIYKLPHSHRNFTIKNLQRFDSLINPNDKLSLGSSKLYSLH